MRIAIIHHRYALRGGMETYLLELLRGFQDAGDTVRVFAQKVDPVLAARGASPVLDLSSPWTPHRLRPALFARRVRQAIQPADFDLVISLTRTNCQDVIVCGGTHRGYLAAMGKRPRMFDRLQVWLEGAGFAQTRTIIAHSRRVATEITSLYPVASDKVVTLYPPINREGYRYVSQHERRRFREELGVAANKIALLFAGSAHPCKAYDELLAAMDQLPTNRYELVVAGRCPRSRRSYVRAIGFHPDLRAIYGAVDLTVLPSRYEAFGLVVAESLECGTPVVVSDHVGAGELVGPGEGLVRPMADSTAIAAAIETAVGAAHRCPGIRFTKWSVDARPCPADEGTR